MILKARVGTPVPIAPVHARIIIIDIKKPLPVGIDRPYRVKKSGNQCISNRRSVDGERFELHPVSRPFVFRTVIASHNK